MAIQVCISEVDARKKWCPFAANEAEPVAPSLTRCLGSGCMAWRWVFTHINDPNNPSGDLIESSDTHGYCGLAGASPYLGSKR